MEQIRRRVVSTGLALALAATTFAAATPATAAPTTAPASVVLVAAKAGAPKVSAQPKALTQANGKAAKFTVKATGKSLKYQWYIKKPGSTKWVKATGASAKKATYSVKSTTKLNGSQVRVIVTNTKGKVTSKAAKLTVVTTPKITTQPRALTIGTGKKATFSVKAKGGSLKYQWQANSGSGWKNISGATKASYSLTVRAKNELTDYRVVVTNKAGKKTSKIATLFVDSSVSDPMSAGQYFYLYSWIAAFDRTYVEKSVEDPGHEDVWVEIWLSNDSTSTRRPGDDLYLTYRASNGKEYDSAGYEIEDDISQAASVRSGQSSTVLGYALVPQGLAKGGRWVIRDFSGNVIQYVKGY